MTSLYRRMLSPWASWEMTAKGHDPTNLLCRDFSGNGRHLTIGDGLGADQPTKLSNQRGYDRASGVDQYLSLSSVAWTAGVITVEVHIRISQVATGASVGFGSGLGEVCTMVHGPDLRFYCGTILSVNNGAGITYAQPPATQHLVGRYDGTNTELFIDGESVATATTPLAPNAGTHDLKIFELDNGLQNITSQIFHVAIWDQALSNIEIQELARLAKQRLARI